jgi:tRNA-splicing ligase RtcB
MEAKLKKIDDWRWEIPKSGSMRVPGLIFSSPELLDQIKNDQSVIQVANVATLPGIVRHSLAMPDIHWGYGFPIGGVAAFDMEEGVVSPGGVGYDINCGVRLLTTSLPVMEIRPRIKEVVSALFMSVPTGVGSRGKIKLSKSEEKRVAAEGASWAIKNGADPEAVSDRAYKRGHDEVGTLGSGNHFLEIQYVDEIYDQKTASAFNLFEGQLTILIHTGSRGFGHQICDDFLKEMSSHVQDAGFILPDRQLACAYIKSETGKRYLSAMACAANYAWVNRQVIMHWTRETFESVLGISPRDLKMALLYDVCHNIAKIESHMVDGKKTKVCVHRKGATRSLPPNHPDVPQKYREAGQPVIIPGDMGTYSYVLAGSQKAMDETFGSTCHGAGRVLSRRQAVKLAKGRAIAREMEDRGIFVQSRGRNTLKEEIPEAYKEFTWPGWQRKWPG